ncbi:MAG: phosphotransferase [Thermoanaerobaculia bacterium]|nr:phosphotransferase [Thermoanaerobaculia bacterium]
MPPPVPQTPSEELRAWATLHAGPFRRWERLAGDLSARAYYRLRRAVGETAVLAVYPAELAADCGRFLRSTCLLEGARVRAPKVLAADCGRGWMLLEDLGEATVADLAPAPRRLAAYFRHAAGLIARIAALPRAAVAELNPPLDGDLLAAELDLTRRAFLGPRGLLEGLGKAYDDAAAALCATLGGEEPVPCHRDFMVRNLLPCGEPPALAVIDHQGLRLGPPAYDLASLLNDTLFPSAAVERALLDAVLGPGPRPGYHGAAAQRALKAVGTYAASASAGRPRHAGLIAPTFVRALDHLARLPATADLAAALSARWAAVC